MADITFDSITNATTVTDGTGHFDVLMKSISLHIEDQYTKGRLKGTDYANVYLGAMQSAMQLAEQFALQEQLTEAQIDDAKAATKLKEGQLALERDKAEAELEKHWGYTVTRDSDDDSLILGTSTGLGKIDEEVDLLQSQDLEVIAQTSRSNSLAASDIAIKYQQELAEKIKNGDVTVEYSYTYIDETTGAPVGPLTSSNLEYITGLNGFFIKDTTYTDAGSSTSIYALELAKLINEANLVNKQTAQAVAQTDLLQQKVVGRAQVPSV